MKKTIYMLSVFAIAFSSCSKDDGSSDLAQPVPDQSVTVPSNFGKKVLIEEFTGAWCGYCPFGAYMFDSLSTKVYPGKLVCIAVHVSAGAPGSEVMECPQLVTTSANLLGDYFNLTGGVPAGVVDRDTSANPVFWPYWFPTELAKFAPCGFSIDATSLSGNSLSVTVHTGFSSNLYGDYRLNVMVVEDNVHSAGNTEYDQHNYYSATGSSPDPTLPYYNMPPVINDFHHMNVLRKLLTGVPFGDKIPQDQMVKGHEYNTNYTVDLTGYDKSNTFIVAYLDKYSTVPTTVHAYPQHQIQNVQRVKVGASSGWN